MHVYIFVHLAQFNKNRLCNCAIMGKYQFQKADIPNEINVFSLWKENKPLTLKRHSSATKWKLSKESDFLQTGTFMQAAGRLTVGDIRGLTFTHERTPGGP